MKTRKMKCDKGCEEFLNAARSRFRTEPLKSFRCPRLQLCELVEPNSISITGHLHRLKQWTHDLLLTT